MVTFCMQFLDTPLQRNQTTAAASFTDCLNTSQNEVIINKKMILWKQQTCTKLLMLQSTVK